MNEKAAFMIKLVGSTIIVLTLSMRPILSHGQSTAATAPNDSCAVSIQYGTDLYWLCDEGPYKYSLSSSKKAQRIDYKEWSKVKALINLKTDSSPIHNEARVPNDSCAVQFHLGSEHFLKCDQGLFKIVNSKVSQINLKTWTKAVSAMPSGPQSEDDLAGCEKQGHTILCPDGVYKKDSHVDTTTEGVVEKMNHSTGRPLPEGPQVITPQ